MESSAKVCVGAAWDASVLDWYWRDAVEATFRAASQSISLQGKMVLELGCGGGELTRLIATAGAQVVGLDLSRPGIRVRQDVGATDRGDCHVSFVLADLHQVPFRDATFDVVVSCSTLQYVDSTRALAEAARVIKDGGLLILHENRNGNPLVAIHRAIRYLRARASGRTSYVESIRTYFSGSHSAAFGSSFTKLHESHHHLLSVLAFGAPQELRQPMWRWLCRLDRCLLGHLSWLRRGCWQVALVGVRHERAQS